ncbi:MAG: hypothetical protein IKD22_06595 [Lentisphaeria bacterium]|nr:hypothetical protein [Lentisphaeria bacterium]
MKKFLLSSIIFLPLLLISANSPFSWEFSESGDTATFTLTVDAGHYIDSEAVSFDIKDRSGKTVVPQFKGNMPQKFTPGKWLWQLSGNGFSGTVSYQGCSDEGVCFMPAEVQFRSAPKTNTLSAISDADNYQLIRKAEGTMNENQFMDFLKGNENKGFFGDAGIIGILLLTLLGGLGLNLTPCILPMVPVTLIIIGAKGGGAAGFRRGLAYGCGMAAAYGLLGIGAALLGIGFGSINSMPTFNFIIAGIFVLLALCMAGVFNFNFGSSLRISPQKLKGAAWAVAFIMGAMAALLAGACVAPVVISVLIFVAKEYNSGNHWALFLPFLLGIGMALPWPFAGMGLSVLPKPGKFMLAVKYILALAVFGMGIYYFSLGWKLLKNQPDEPGTTAISDPFTALERAAETARTANKPLLIKFGASWCRN